MAGKASLLDYQRELSDRLKDASAGRSAAMLGVQAGGEAWLVDLADAAEVIPVPPITPVPLTRTWFKGMTNVRGNLYSVVDFSAFLGRGPVALGDQPRLLLLGERYRLAAALLVERALGLRQLGQMRVSEGDPESWMRARYTDSDGREWKQLDVPRLAQHPDFMHVA